MVSQPLGSTEPVQRAPDPLTNVPAISETSARPGPLRRWWSVLPRDLAMDRLSGVYVIIIMIIAFSLWEPATFGTWANARIVVSSQAITGIVTLAAMIGLVVGVLDLSVAANMSLAISLVAVLQVSAHLNPVVAILVTLASGALVGCVNAFIVTRIGIDAVIGTLATSSILAAITYWIANGQDIVYGISPGFARMGSETPLGIPITVYYLLGIALILWYVLEHTPVGRYLYAAGANPRAARLSGVNVVRLQWGALITSGVLSSAAGIAFTMQLGTASFDAGNSYLLPAFAGAFLGSTQIKPGRFNVPGTIVAIYLVAVGVKGLQLRFPQYAWIAELVDGIILLVAVGVAVNSARRRARAPRSLLTT
jgi:ribose transport system permease protein